MTLIPFIAKKLGVEIGDKFMVTGYEDVKFQFWKTDRREIEPELGLIVAPESENIFHSDYRTVLDDIVTGRQEVIKLPWEPKMNDFYYTIVWDASMTPEVLRTQFKGYSNDYMRLRLGNFFRSEREAGICKFVMFDKIAKGK